MAPRPPQISVLLPARNAEPWIREAVGDLLNQVGVELQILAVDDGSTDHTRRLLDEIAARDSRLRVLDGEGRGPAAALNLALHHAGAACIGQMEADDRCPPDRFRVLWDALHEQADRDAVVSQVRLIGAERGGMQRYADWQNRLLAPADLAQARFIEIPAMHQTGLYRRAALEQLDGYREDPRWPLDIDFWMRWFEGGLRAAKVERPLYAWRQHPRQTTRVSPRHRKEALRACKVHYFLRGPARGRPVDLFTVGETLRDWSADLRAAGCEDLRATSWRPDAGDPGGRVGAVRLFVFGVVAVRRRARAALAAFDPERDWFAA